jgi:chemotaxis methyl-accepting protein methylase
VERPNSGSGHSQTDQLIGADVLVLEFDLRRKLEQTTGFSIPDQRWPALFKRCQQGADFNEQLALTTIGKTELFRDLPWYFALENHILPDLKRRQKPWTIWSAGCSTGEESYSIAALVQLTLGSNARDVQLLATDLIEKRLNQARLGVYKKPDKLCIPRRYHSFFKSVDDYHWQLRNPEFRPHFQAHNLVLEPCPTSRRGLWDLIICRNVLIYFSPELLRQTLLKFHAALSDGGWLVTAPAETLLEHQDLFEVELCEDAFYFRKRDR